MSSFSDFITNLSSFNNDIVIPFISSFFTENIGIAFVGFVSFAVVIAVLAKLLKTKF